LIREAAFRDCLQESGTAEISQQSFIRLIISSGARVVKLNQSRPERISTKSVGSPAAVLFAFRPAGSEQLNLTQRYSQTHPSLKLFWGNRERRNKTQILHLDPPEQQIDLRLHTLPQTEMFGADTVQPLKIPPALYAEPSLQDYGVKGYERYQLSEENCQHAMKRYAVEFRKEVIMMRVIRNAVCYVNCLRLSLFLRKTTTFATGTTWPFQEERKRPDHTLCRSTDV
jgi:hypothetical protein